MLSQEREQFEALWLRTLALYNQTASNDVLDDVFEILQGFPLTDIKRALLAHKRNPKEGRFMPLPSDVVRYIVGDADSLSQLAWAKVEKAISSVGIYQSVVFDDSIIMATINELGGWIKLCNTSGDKFQYLKNDFARLYRGYLNRPPSVWPKHFAGLEEADKNMRSGGKVDPILVGNAYQAKLVYEMGGEVRQEAVPLSKFLNTLKLTADKNTKTLLTKD